MKVWKKMSNKEICNLIGLHELDKWMRYYGGKGEYVLLDKEKYKIINGELYKKR